VSTLFELALLCRQITALPQNLWRFSRLTRFRKGEIYLDCSGHVVVATEVTLYGGLLGPWDRHLAGISLLDGSGPRGCSCVHCAPRKLDYNEALNYLALYAQRRLMDERIYQIYEHSPELQQVWPH
jgi:hypothetical protein